MITYTAAYAHTTSYDFLYRHYIHLSLWKIQFVTGIGKSDDKIDYSRFEGRGGVRDPVEEHLNIKNNIKFKWQSCILHVINSF